MDCSRLVVAVALLASGCASPVSTPPGVASPTGTLAADAPGSLDGARLWINGPPTPLANLRGHVVLIEFWTYTCVNWRRTLPYLRAWNAAYRDRGLIVIGVHTPEFEFERDPANVRVATRQADIDYPVAVDSDFRIWNSFGNHYWPALYIVDGQGRIRHRQFGEGGYAASEVVIRALLTEAGGPPLGPPRSSTVGGRGAEAAADWDDLKSPETYVGYDHPERFASAGHARGDQSAGYSAPARLEINQWALSGTWSLRAQSAALGEHQGAISYRFHARDVNLVMGPTSPPQAHRFRVLIDGNPPGGSHGVDVDADGYGVVDFPRMYQLIRQPAPIEDRTVEVFFPDGNAIVYDFTFG